MAKSKGLSTIDMMSMSVSVRRISRIMIKSRRVKYDDLLAEIAKLPTDKRLSEEELKETLEEMVRDEWITKDVTPDGIFYDVQMAKKEGTKSKKAPREIRRRSSSAIKNVWDTLDETSDSSKKDDDDKSKPDPLSKLLS